jgi:hypothetical protein
VLSFFTNLIDVIQKPFLMLIKHKNRYFQHITDKKTGDCVKLMIPFAKVAFMVWNQNKSSGQAPFVAGKFQKELGVHPAVKTANTSAYSLLERVVFQELLQKSWFSIYLMIQHLDETWSGTSKPPRPLAQYLSKIQKTFKDLPDGGSSISGVLKPLLMARCLEYGPTSKRISNEVTVEITQYYETFLEKLNAYLSQKGEDLSTLRLNSLKEIIIEQRLAKYRKLSALPGVIEAA